MLYDFMFPGVNLPENCLPDARTLRRAVGVAHRVVDSPVEPRHRHLSCRRSEARERLDWMAERDMSGVIKGRTIAEQV